MRIAVALGGLALAVSVLEVHPAGQVRPTASSFDVASVKPSVADSRGYTQSSPGRFGSNDYLLRTIMLAFGAREYELIGIPEWVRRERFTIEARLPDGLQLRNTMQPNGALRLLPPGAMEELLRERFALRVRRETRELDLYRLVLAPAQPDGRLGPNLRRVTTSCTPLPGMLSPCRFGGSATGYASTGIRWDQGYLLGAMSEHLGAPVVDETGLSGQFDIRLDWTRQLVVLPDGLGIPDYISLFTAVEDQLGLKLIRGRGPVEMLVIENVERPTPD